MGENRGREFTGWHTRDTSVRLSASLCKLPKTGYLLHELNKTSTSPIKTHIKVVSVMNKQSKEIVRAQCNICAPLQAESEVGKERTSTSVSCKSNTAKAARIPSQKTVARRCQLTCYFRPLGVCLGSSLNDHA